MTTCFNGIYFLFLGKFHIFSGENFSHFIKKWQPVSTEFFFFFIRKFHIFCGENFSHFIRKWQPVSTDFFLFFIRKFPNFSGDFYLRFIGTSWPFSTEKSIFYSYTAEIELFLHFSFFLIRKNLYRKSTTLRGQKLSAFVWAQQKQWTMSEKNITKMNGIWVW